MIWAAGGGMEERSAGTPTMGIGEEDGDGEALVLL